MNPLNRRLREDQDRITDLESGVAWPDGLDEKTLRRLIRLGYEFPVEPNPHWWASLGVTLSAFLVLSIALTAQGMTIGALVLVVSSLAVLAALIWSTKKHRDRNVVPRLIAAHTVDHGSSPTLAKLRQRLREVEEIGHRVAEVTDANPLLAYLDEQIDVMYVSLRVLRDSTGDNSRAGIATRTFALQAMGVLTRDVHSRATFIDQRIIGARANTPAELTASVVKALEAPLGEVSE